MNYDELGDLTNHAFVVLIHGNEERLVGPFWTGPEAEETTAQGIVDSMGVSFRPTQPSNFSRRRKYDYGWSEPWEVKGDCVLRSGDVIEVRTPCVHEFERWRDTDGLGAWGQFRRCVVCGHSEIRSKDYGPDQTRGPWKDSHTDRSVAYYVRGYKRFGDSFAAFIVRLLWSTFRFCWGAG